MVELIQLSERFGTTSKAMTDYLGAQGTASLQGFTSYLTIGADAIRKLGDDSVKTDAEIQTLTGIIAATAITTQGAADAMAAGVMADFEAMINSGKSYGEAVAAISPAMEALAVQMDAAGLQGSAVYTALQEQVQLYSDAIAGPALSAVDGLTQGMVALDNMGKMNQDTFAALSGQVNQTFSSLIEQGYDSTTVMLGMKDSLQRMWEEQQEFGYTTDDSTQALIDQAEAEGIVGEKHKSVSEQMLDATNKMVDVLTKVAETLGATIPDEAASGAKKVQSHLNAIQAPALHVQVVYDDPGPPHHEAGTASMGGMVTPGGIRHLAGGGEAGPAPPPFRPSGTDVIPAMLTPGERVLSVEQNRVYESKDQNNTELERLRKAQERQSRYLMTDFKNDIARAIRDEMQKGRAA